MADYKTLLIVGPVIGQRLKDKIITVMKKEELYLQRLQLVTCRRSNPKSIVNDQVANPHCRHTL